MACCFDYHYPVTYCGATESRLEKKIAEVHRQAKVRMDMHDYTLRRQGERLTALEQKAPIGGTTINKDKLVALLEQRVKTWSEFALSDKPYYRGLYTAYDRVLTYVKNECG